MTLRPGATIWLPCEVRPGPFSNERMVRVATHGDPWVGFVDMQFLREPIVEGSTDIRARIVDLSGDSFLAALPGDPVSSSSPLFRGSIALALPA